MIIIDIKKMPDPKKGTGKKPKGSGRRLYTDENPKDKVCNYEGCNSYSK